MLAWILLAVIVAEGALFAALGAWLLPREWAHWPALLLCAISGIIFVRALMVAVSFAVAWRHRTPRRPDQQIGWGQSLALYGRETWAQILAFAFLQPLAWWFTPKQGDHATPVSSTPVLLVHGLWCNAAVWWKFAQRLRAAGVGPLFTVNLEPPLADIEQLADRLAARVDAVCAATGATKVTVVAHSMGGLVTLAYLRKHGAMRVEKLLSLATPYHGSTHARMSFGRCVEQMRSGNAWLSELIRCETLRPLTSVVSFYSLHDNLVAPQASSVLANARNVPLTGIGHMEFLVRPDVCERVVAEIEVSPAHPASRQSVATV